MPPGRTPSCCCGGTSERASKRNLLKLPAFGLPMKMESLLNVAVIVTAVCALAVTGLVVRREFFAPTSTPPAPKHISDWRGYASAEERDGPTAAPVTIVEFEDFQCPFCRAMGPRLDSVRAAMPDRVAIVHRHFPLDIHPLARPAALAAACAGEQRQFARYAAALYAGQDTIARMSWGRVAAQVGVPDIPRFEECVTSQRHTHTINRDIAAGRQLGITGTPAFLVNGTLVPGAISTAALRSLVEGAGR